MTGMTRRNALNTPSKFSLKEIEAQCKGAILSAQSKKISSDVSLTMDEIADILFNTFNR
jgi:hypothetical protein